KPGATLIALASWAKEAAACRLAFDWKALGLDANTARLHAPAIPGFQPAAHFSPSDPIPVDPGKGWLLSLVSVTGSKNSSCSCRGPRWK
ncbi:MAG: DUF6067 family protein, partial [Kiritimatiellaeota bacterium]|nr:DUF6067 family protein [Kiritimatiellota bacterium]